MRVIADLAELSALVGQEVAVSDWFQIDQERINVFADATNDRQWIHLDPERAERESPFKSTVAHGFLTLSLLPFMVSSSLRIDGPRFVVNYGISRVRFPGPVKAGSRIRARVKLAEFKSITGGAQLEWLVNVEREGELKLACIAGLLVRCYN